MMKNRRMSSRSVSLTSTFLLLAAGGVAACDNDDDYEDAGFYCADANGVVVDEDNCDDDDDRGGSGLGALPFFIWYSSGYRSGYPVGTKLPPGGNRFAYNDTKARQSFGLPASGRIGNGTIKTSVVGKGGAARSSSKSSGG
ncbi:hypothetical protein C8E87_4161 [Paractinoplanes brasiliensis]|uniref:Peptidase inhibitor family I36 n=2 Tax=Paractinoplanes brasiliensis TaxID=52695 RepID=A0A4R6JW29_9ACTN|nr:hypothetical protein C8E87_4161 [Actinoplanes brasiliensis]